MTSSVGSISQFVQNTLNNAAEDEQTAAKIGSNLNNLEETLLDLYSRGDWESSETAEQRAAYLRDNNLGGLIESPSTGKSLMDRIPSMEGVRKAVELRYQRAVRAFEGFSTLMKNASEILQRAIQNLRVG